MVARDRGAGLAPPVFERPTRVLIIAAPFYRAIADNHIAGARTAIEAARATQETVEVPGALEIPVAIRLAARAARFDGFVALGCVIRGETTHYELVANDSSRGIMELGTRLGLAIGNGVLTVENEAQAIERADPARQDKGGGAALAALTLIAFRRRLQGA